MTYSLDIRTRVVDYVAQGGSKSDASRIFKVGRQTIYNWLSSDDLHPKRHGSRRRKLDIVALASDVRNYPDSYLYERASRFGVSTVAIFKALRKMKIVKKND